MVSVEEVGFGWGWPGFESHADNWKVGGPQFNSTTLCK